MDGPPLRLAILASSPVTLKKDTTVKTKGEAEITVYPKTTVVANVKILTPWVTEAGADNDGRSFYIPTNTPILLVSVTSFLVPNDMATTTRADYLDVTAAKVEVQLKKKTIIRVVHSLTEDQETALMQII